MNSPTVSQVAEVTRNRIARLNPDGTLDQTQERLDDRAMLVRFVAAAWDEEATAKFLRQGAFYGFTK